MKILLTSPFFPPENSGLANVVAMHAEVLSGLGFDVTVATRGSDRSTRRMGRTMIETFPVSGAFSLLAPIRGASRDYREFLGTSKFDLTMFHAWQNWATDIGLLNLNQIAGKKLVFSHCVSTNTLFLHQPARSAIRYASWRPYWWRLPGWMKALDGVIFLSREGDGDRFDDLKLAGCLGTKTYFVSNCSVLGAGREHEGLWDKWNGPIISVGSYEWFKGFDFVLRAYAASTAKNQISLKLFGQKFTRFTQKLRSLADELDIAPQFVEFHEGVFGEALQQEYREAQLFVCGSHTECQPLVLLDAMASGTPFVSRKTGCIASLAGGRAVRTEREAAGEISKLLSDRSRWEALRKNGLEAASNEFSLMALKRNLGSVVRDVLGVYP